VQRAAGIALILAAVGYVLGIVVGDPAVEEYETRETLASKVEDVADRIPAIYAFQIVAVAGSFFAVAGGLGLYLMLRERARGPALAGLLLFLVSAVFNAGTAMVGAGMTLAADDFAGGGIEGVGSGADSTLQLIRSLGAIHFASFLTAFAALGLGAASFAHSLVWQAGVAPRWLGWLGLVAGALMLFTPFAIATVVFFLPFLLGTILTIVWLLSAGIWLALRAPAAVADTASA
jgi:hypothetical protein